jgi:hypothetical protein
MTPVHALTHRSRGILKQIITDIEVKNLFTGKITSTKAIWDTGATNSVVTENTAQSIGLSSMGKTQVTGVHGVKIVNRYFVNITLNNKSITLDVPVTECSSLSPDESIGVLIGMDIITLGDFAITNFGNDTFMSFRVPSIQHIDFVDGITHSNPLVNAKLPSRNDPCTCGSGKKYKYCCGKI